MPAKALGFVLTSGPFLVYEAAEAARRIAGQVDGRHYTALVPAIKAARAAGDDDAAAGLLLRAIEAVEREARIPLAGHEQIPGWYFDQLAAIYKRAGRERDRALVIQRKTVLAAEVETSGRLALARLRAASADAAVQPKPAAIAAGRAAGSAVRAGASLVGALLNRATRDRRK